VAGLSLATKKTRKREHLEETERVVPRAVLVQIVEAHCRKAKALTGGANGIGLASAARSCRDGCNVVIADRGGDAAVWQATRLDERAIGVPVDVRLRASVVQVFDMAFERFERIDIVHADAGVSSMWRAIGLTDADWDFNFDVNARGVPDQPDCGAPLRGCAHSWRHRQ
jgi:NAD(P)-dependent dehydrogenase (short-subunit alcohol dehydrogenase family)